MRLTDQQKNVIKEVLENYLSEDLADTIMIDIEMELESADE